MIVTADVDKAVIRIDSAHMMLDDMLDTMIVSLFVIDQGACFSLPFLDGSVLSVLSYMEIDLVDLY